MVYKGVHPNDLNLIFNVSLYLNIKIEKQKPLINEASFEKNYP